MQEQDPKPQSSPPPAGAGGFISAPADGATIPRNGAVISGTHNLPVTLAFGVKMVDSVTNAIIFPAAAPAQPAGVLVNWSVTFNGLVANRIYLCTAFPIVNNVPQPGDTRGYTT